MASENRSFEQSDKPILCANGCGFFGTAATMNLCSKCYRDHRLKEEQAASAKAAVEKSMAPPAVALVVEPKAFNAPAAAGTSKSSSAVAAAEPTPARPANRCASCNKKVGLMGFKCKCGGTFCGSHRYEKEHNCSFDYKASGRDAIAKANPIIKADKIQRF